MKIDIEITYLGEDVNVSAGASQMVVAFEFYDGNFPSSSGGGAVDSVNGKTGTVVLGANDINESSTRFWLTDVLKTAYDGAVTNATNAINWITTNGTSLLNHLSNTDNPHNTTASQVGAYTSSEVNTLLGNKANVSEVAIVLFKSITPTITTGKTVETSIYSIPLPTDGHNYMIRVYSQAQITTMAGLLIAHRLRVGSYLTPIDGASGADAIGNQTQITQNGASSALGMGIVRNLIFNGGASGSIVGLVSNQSILTDETSVFSFTTLASKDFTTQQYLYISFSPNNAGASVLHNQVLVTAIKI